MPTKNVSLSEQQTRFINKSVHSGRFRNASEVVRAGLRLLEENQREEAARIAILRKIEAQAMEEMERGEYEEIGPGGIDQFMEKVDAKVRASLKKCVSGFDFPSA